MDLITVAANIATVAIPLITGKNKKPPNDDAARNERIKAAINEVLNIGLGQFPVGSEEYNKIYKAIPHFNGLPVYTDNEYIEVESFVNSVINTYNTKMASGQSTFNADTFKPQIQKDYSLGPEGADAEHKYNLIVDKINSLNIPSPGEAAKSNLNFIIPAIGLGLIVFGILIPKKRRQ